MINTLYLLLIPFLVLAPAKTADHGLYISILEIKDREMKIKVFSDNLEDAIRNGTGNVEAYFKKKVKLKINDQNIDFNLKEINEESDSQWITFELTSPKTWQSLELEADYFMELFPTQINVVKLLVGKPQYFRLSRQKTSCSFSFAPTD